MHFNFRESMHDFFLAKEVVEEILRISKKKNITSVKSVSLEIGSTVACHDYSHKEMDNHFHSENLNIDNVLFGIKEIAKNTILRNANFDIKKTSGAEWKITNIEV